MSIFCGDMLCHHCAYSNVNVTIFIHKFALVIYSESNMQIIHPLTVLAFTECLLSTIVINSFYHLVDTPVLMWFALFAYAEDAF